MTLTRALCAVPLCAALFAAGPAAAQEAAPKADVPAEKPAEKVPPSDLEQLRKELEAARREIKDLREEVRAQLATQSATTGWQDEWTEEKHKLEVLVPDGYFRMRPELFHHLDLNRARDPSGYWAFPRGPPTAQEAGWASSRDRTYAGVNMRFRFEPTFNVSEEVRIRSQIDMLDNVMFGSTPDYAFSRNAASGYGYDSNEFTVFSQSQSAPNSGFNALVDSIQVKRVWGEVTTPIGILRFGRMGSHWGLGILHNDGSGLDANFGDNVDRMSFTAEPFTGWFITPMLDFNAEGPGSSPESSSGQVFDLSQQDDAHGLALAIARRDTDTQARAKLESGGTVFNFGVHFTYRWQNKDSADYYNQPFTENGQNAPDIQGSFVQRNAQLFLPDIWLKLERKNFKIELEAAAVLGGIGNRATSGVLNDAVGQNQRLEIWQFAAVLQGEVRLLDNEALTIGGEIGYASGDNQPGFGARPRRKVAGPDNNTQYGDFDGRQYSCQSTGGCEDWAIRNFRFNRAYNVDMILYKELIGTVTDSIYFKPTVAYRIADGFNAWASLIYSRAIYGESTPSATVITDANGVQTVKSDQNLGVEINVGARYETEDGFYGQLMWGILFPLDGFKDPRILGGQSAPLESAQALRGSVGIRF